MPKEKEDDKSNDKPEGLKDQMETLFSAVKSLTEGFSTMQKNVNDLTTNVNTYMEKANEPAPKREEEDPPLDDDDLERMDRKGFLNVIMKGVEKAIAPIKQEVDAKVSDVSSRVSNSDLRAEVEAVKKAHPDIEEWKDEILKIAEATPGLSVRRMITLAKSENPEKVEELSKDERFQPKDAGTEQKGGKYGGLTPSGGGTSDTPTDMSKDDAAEKAWENTMADVELFDGN